MPTFSQRSYKSVFEIRQYSLKVCSYIAVPFLSRRQIIAVFADHFDHFPAHLGYLAALNIVMDKTSQTLIIITHMNLSAQQMDRGETPFSPLTYCLRFQTKTVETVVGPQGHFVESIEAQT